MSQNCRVTKNYKEIVESYEKIRSIIPPSEKRQYDGYIFGFYIDVLMLCIKEFQENYGKICSIDKYEIETFLINENICRISIIPIIHDWMEGIPIPEKEAGRDGLGVTYTVELKSIKIIDIKWSR